MLEKNEMIKWAADVALTASASNWWEHKKGHLSRRQLGMKNLPGVSDTIHLYLRNLRTVIKKVFDGWNSETKQ